jgi:hypothetical protein
LATRYNWVHPNNEQFIAFLRKRGYDVLNLLEVRQPLTGEELRTMIKIAKHEYKY